MCHVGEALQMAGLEEVGELPIEDLSIWAVHLANKQKREDERWDRRCYGICVAIKAFLVGGIDFDPKVYFPSLFDDSTDARADETKQAIMNWAAMASGRQQQMEI